MQISKEAFVLHVHLVGVHAHHSASVLHFDVPAHVVSSACEWLRPTSALRRRCRGDHKREMSAWAAVSAREETFIRELRESANGRYGPSCDECHVASNAA